jgi:NADP-dependent 3-hydroxy acid dehydrogenase YdfG
VEREFQGLDILVNNAGIGHFAAAGAVEPQDWDRVLATNLTGVFQCCRGALPLMRAAGAGHIINVSSLAGKNAFAGGAVYNASKFGLNGFTEALMLDYRYENIRVGLIAPGSVDAEFSPRRTPEADSGDAEWKIAPEDVAEAVLGMLRMPPRTTVSLIEVRPSKPKRR